MMIWIRIATAIIAFFLGLGQIVAQQSIGEKRIVVKMPKPNSRILYSLLAVSNDGKHAIVGDSIGRLVFVDTNKNQILQVSTEHKNAVSGLSVLKDSVGVVTVSLDGDLILWDSVEGGDQRVVAQLPDKSTSVAPHPDGHSVAAACYDGHVYVCAIKESTAELRKISGHKAKTTKVIYSADGGHLISGDTEGVIKSWDTRKWIERGSTTVSGSINAIEISPDGKFVAVSDVKAGITILEFKDGVFKVSPRQPKGYGKNATAIDFSPDGETIAATTLEGIALWTMNDLEKPKYLDAGTTCMAARFMPDGKAMMVVDGDGVLSVINLP